MGAKRPKLLRRQTGDALGAYGDRISDTQLIDKTAKRICYDRIQFNYIAALFGVAPRNRSRGLTGRAGDIILGRIHLATRLQVLKRFVSGGNRRAAAEGEEEGGDQQREGDITLTQWGARMILTGA
jgi:hypothetical protein